MHDASRPIVGASGPLLTVEGQPAVRDRAAARGEESRLVSAPQSRSLGPYRLLERIGPCGMSTVYRAQPQPLGRAAAIAILPAGLMAEEVFLGSFEREAASAARQPPNILAVWGYGEEDDTLT